MSKVWALGVTYHGERLRDAGVGVSVWATAEAAEKAIREDFAEQIETADELLSASEVAELGDFDKLADYLKWYCDIIVELCQCDVLEA